MYPFNTLKFTIIYNQCGYNFLYSNSWFELPRPAVSTIALVLNWKWLPLFNSWFVVKLTALAWTENNWASNQKISVNVPIQYFEIYNQYGYNFLYSNSWFVVELTNLTLSRVLPRHAMSTTAPVLNWKWLPLFQFLICSETHTLVLNWKWLGFKSLGKFEQMYPFYTLKFTIRKFEWMYPFNILKFTISMGTISSIPIPDLYYQGPPWVPQPKCWTGNDYLYSNSWFVVEFMPWCWTGYDWALDNWENLSECTHSIFWNLQSVRVQFPLFQFLICSETHTLVLNWKWLAFKSLGKFERMYPLNILKFTIRKFEWMYPFNILKFTISVGTISSIPIPDLYCQGLLWIQQP